ncbi:MAG: tail fiber protein [Pseudomonadota bacterium]
MEPFIGQIQAFGFNFAPRGWALCNGQLLAINSNTALFSLIGTFYGGDGRTTFALPDLRGRSPMHYGTGAGLSPRPIGQRAGVEGVTLSVAQIPPHSHSGEVAPGTTRPVTIAAYDGEGTEEDADGHVLASAPSIYSASTPDTSLNAAAASVDLAGTPVAGNLTGGGLSHTNMPPYLVLNYCIALQGIYPSRS